jgi:hypothetical protein
MKLTHRFAAALALAGVLPVWSFAQAPPAGTGGNPPGAVRKPLSGTTSPAAALKRRSIVHHYPYPYPDYYHGDQYAGFRNPGGVGRYAEYYPPGDRFQENIDPVRAAHFDTGFGNRQEQLQSEQVGVQRDNAIMNHIDSMARPAFGIGYFGGFY